MMLLIYCGFHPLWGKKHLVKSFFFTLIDESRCITHVYTQGGNPTSSKITTDKKTESCGKIIWSIKNENLSDRDFCWIFEWSGMILHLHLCIRIFEMPPPSNAKKIVENFEIWQLFSSSSHALNLLDFIICLICV